ncbi:GDP/GTP exchange factor [Durotheca rogersii]|uniref:GDP/GTP exchange factor n=1 Tax=Durotheca rogersii TaxID=419775 RepID=UPI00221E93F7|nr:GDP/GTP exchange factor [Durotheca rogersii]KAI5861317.1 GDP/GTP exchange factor [Durotheca rogersii]
MPPKDNKDAKAPAPAKKATAKATAAKAAAPKAPKSKNVKTESKAAPRAGRRAAATTVAEAEPNPKAKTGTTKAPARRQKREPEVNDQGDESIDNSGAVEATAVDGGRGKGRSKVSKTGASKTTKSKPATSKAAPKPAASKRKRDDEDEDLGEAPQAKKSRSESEQPATKAVPKATARHIPALPRGVGKRGTPFNEVPNKEFDVFVFGEGSSGELGLGSKKYDGKRPIDVKRPRLNHNLKGVVNIACGGMHVVVLTSDQQILTWGVNDDKALGRDTFWEGGTRDIDASEDEDDDDDTGMNPLESTPGPVNLDILPEGTKIVQVAATDSASFALTDDGRVYGWGTFRSSDGIIGFSEQTRIQETPVIVPDLKNITKLACGSNHVLALDLDGKVFTWGNGGQYQLGRKPLTRHGGPTTGLRPQSCGKFSKKHRAVGVGAGSYHSFYIDTDDQVWAWGLNNYAQTGIDAGTGEDDAMILQPRVVESLGQYKVSQVVGGEHHSVACTTDGRLLTWGRVDGHQVGHRAAIFNKENTVSDDSGKPRILLHPTPIEGIHATFVAAGTDTSFSLDDGGKVYSWGFSANYQTGQGITEDVEVPTLIDNSAIRDRKIVWAGAGGQYSIVAAEKGEGLVNGH